MARWGLEVFDPGGNLVIDDRHLLHRLWHVQEVFSANDDVTYAEPLDHEPTVLLTGISYWPFMWEHKRSGNLYTGLILEDNGIVVSDHSLIVVYARR